MDIQELFFKKGCNCNYCVRNNRKYPKIHKNKRLWIHKIKTENGTKINWIEIPKNASSTIKSIDIVSDEIKKTLNIKPETERYFAISRNPYERFLSLYNYYTKGNKSGDKLREKIAKNKVLKNKVSNIKSPTIEDFISILPFLDGRNRCHHFWPQAWFLPKNKDKIIFIDISNIQEELKSKLDINLNIPRKNTQNYSNQLTKKEKEMIYNIYKVDFDLFNYKK